MSLFDELKRRNVFRVAIAYVVSAWLLLQVADVVLNNIDAPDWVFKVFMLALGIGFPLAIMFAWAFELTPEGLKKDSEVDRSVSIAGHTGRKLDRIIMTVLAVALGYLIVDKVFFATETTPPQARDVETRAGDARPSIQAEDRSIAVLPFVNMSSDPEQEYFSDGISEELLNVLAQFRNLRVAARTSSFQFKGENLDIGRIAKQLNVAHVLEGSVRKSGTRLRITAQLIKADDGFHLWSETYDREMDDVFAIQDEIAAAIGEAMEAELGLGATATAGHTPTVIPAANTQAYEAFLLGRQLIHQRGRESLEDAVRHLERSLRLDANYAPAHAQLAIATTMLLESASTYGDLSMAEVTRRATPHINLAFELSPELDAAYAARGLMALHTADPDAALADTRKALEINPSYTDAMNWQQIALARLSRYREADELLREMLEVDPLSVIARLNYANDFVFRDEPAKAHEVADDLFAQSPWASYWKHADASEYVGNIAESLEWSLRAFGENPNDLASNWVLMWSLSRIAEPAEARRVAAALVPYAEIYAGNSEEAVRQIVSRQKADPENQTILSDAANITYLARQFAAAHEYFEEMSRIEGVDRPIGFGVFETTRLAWLRRNAGDDEGAAQAMRIVDRELPALIDAGFAGRWRLVSEAMIAAYNGNTNQAIDLTRQAVERGQSDPLYFTDPLFDEIRNDPQFIEIESRALQALEVERQKALQIMCFKNPVPGAWQPLPQTCKNVREQMSL
jgi:TolB-like protein